MSIVTGTAYDSFINICKTYVVKARSSEASVCKGGSFVEFRVKVRSTSVVNLNSLGLPFRLRVHVIVMLAMYYRMKIVTRLKKIVRELTRTSSTIAVVAMSIQLFA